MCNMCVCLMVLDIRPDVLRAGRSDKGFAHADAAISLVVPAGHCPRPLAALRADPVGRCPATGTRGAVQLIGRARRPATRDHARGDPLFSADLSRKLSQNFYFAFFGSFGTLEARMWPLGPVKVPEPASPCRPPKFSLGGSRKLSQNFYFAFWGGASGTLGAKMVHLEGQNVADWIRQVCRMPKGASVGHLWPRFCGGARTAGWHPDGGRTFPFPGRPSGTGRCPEGSRFGV